MNEKLQMNTIKLNVFVRLALTGLSMVAFAGVSTLISPSLLFSQAKPAQSSPLDQKTFNSPQEAAEALIQAAQSYDVPALNAIFGPAAEEVLWTEDPVQDKNNVTEFAAKAREKNAIAVDPRNRNRAFLVIGNNDWPMAIPIVNRNAKWFFDTKAGSQEMLYRRIGGNELDAIEICRGYVEAQHEYAMERHDGARSQSVRTKSD